MVFAYVLALVLNTGNKSQLDFFSLSLEELTQISVITDSKVEVDRWQASAVMSVITAEEIALMGANNLFDVFDRVPGLHMLHSPAINRLTIRGGDPNQSTSRVLYLIDGKPFRVPGGNLMFYQLFNSFPLSLISRIEIIRGPGSALYGTNAMEGVINIITRKDGAEGSLALKGGAFNTKSVNASLRQAFGDWHLDAGLFFMDTDGWNYELPDTANQGRTTLSEDYWDDSRSARVVLRSKKWVFESFSSKTKQFSYLHTIPDLNFHAEVTQLNSTFRHSFEQGSRVEASLTYNFENFHWHGFGDVTAIEINERSYRGDVSFYHTLNGSLELIAGTALWRHDSNNLGGFATSTYRFMTTSNEGYGQLKYTPSERLEFLFGANYTYQNGNDDLVPRVTARYKLAKDWGFNLFYGEAFRLPISVELFVETPDIQKGDPNLNSERMKNLDIQLFWEREGSFFSATVFQAEQSDLIRQIPKDGYLLHFVNDGTLESQGFEIEGRYLKDQWYVSLAHVRQENENEAGIEDITNAPEWSTKVGLGYSVKHWSLGISYQGYDGFKNTEPEDYVFGYSPKSTDYNLLSANLGMSLNVGKHKARFEIYGQNLLDEDVRAQDFLYSSFNSLPGYSSRAFYGTLRIGW